MVIEYGAFQNCVSLKEIHLEKCDFPVNTNIYNSNVPDDLRIIVNDKVYNESIDKELQANRYRLTLYSDYIQEKIDKISNTKIIQGIIYLSKFIQQSNNQDIVSSLKNIITQLKNKYKISDSIISYVNYLMDKKQEILQNGS